MAHTNDALAFHEADIGLAIVVVIARIETQIVFYACKVGKRRSTNYLVIFLFLFLVMPFN